MTPTTLPALALLTDLRRLQTMDNRRVGELSARIEELVISAAHGVVALQSSDSALSCPGRRRAIRRLQRAVAAFDRPL